MVRRLIGYLYDILIEELLTNMYFFFKMKVVTVLQTTLLRKVDLKKQERRVIKNIERRFAIHSQINKSKLITVSLNKK